MIITHAHVGYANPFLVCCECNRKVPYWHDPDRCGCDSSWYLIPCEHKADVISICPTWSPGYGCDCVDRVLHDKD